MAISFPPTIDCQKSSQVITTKTSPTTTMPVQHAIVSNEHHHSGYVEASSAHQLFNACSKSLVVTKSRNLGNNYRI